MKFFLKKFSNLQKNSTQRKPSSQNQILNYLNMLLTYNRKKINIPSSRYTLLHLTTFFMVDKLKNIHNSSLIRSFFLFFFFSISNNVFSIDLSDISFFLPFPSSAIECLLVRNRTIFLLFNFPNCHSDHDKYRCLIQSVDCTCWH